MLNTSLAPGDSIPFNLKDHWLGDVEVKGKRKWKNARDYWQREGSGKKNSVVRYDCTAEADKIADKGLPMPSLVDWLQVENADFSAKGKDVLSGMSNYSMYDAIEDTTNVNVNKSFFDEGLMYQRRPIMWIVNNTFFCATGVYAYMLTRLPKDVRHLLKWDVTFPVLLDDARSVFVSVKKDDWARFIELPEMMGQPFVTVYVYTYSNVSDKEINGMRKTHFDGYAWPEQYEQVENAALIAPAEADYRRTLYWSPSMKADASGKSSFKFTNNSTCRSFSVSLEGFTNDGRPLICR